MELWTAFILGLVGSLHCAGMCGPLALALPGAGASGLAFHLGRAAYNVGRVTSYALIGLVFGLVGRTLMLAGVQRWASLLAGAVVLLALLPATRVGLGLPAIKSVAWIKAGFASMLRHRSVSAMYLLGVLNGFLPCGLVYVAAAATLSLQSVASAAGYMVAFGVGTIPMMLGIALVGRNVQMAVRFKYQKLVPVCLVLMGTLLILRGLSLGIPYISPDLSMSRSCH
jgi:uncharacterized protein